MYMEIKLKLCSLVSCLFFDQGDPLTPQRLAFFPASIFRRLFIIFFHPKPLEQAIILNLFFQNTHGPFKVIVIDSNRDFLQIFPPPLPLNSDSAGQAGFRNKSLYPHMGLRVKINVRFITEFFNDAIKAWK